MASVCAAARRNVVRDFLSGTNAYVILEEALTPDTSPLSRTFRPRCRGKLGEDMLASPATSPAAVGALHAELSWRSVDVARSAGCPAVSAGAAVTTHRWTPDWFGAPVGEPATGGVRSVSMDLSGPDR